MGLLVLIDTFAINIPPIWGYYRAFPFRAFPCYLLPKLLPGSLKRQGYIFFKRDLFFIQRKLCHDGNSTDNDPSPVGK
jgi:hypothetical protein